MAVWNSFKVWTVSFFTNIISCFVVSGRAVSHQPPRRFAAHPSIDTTPHSYTPSMLLLPTAVQFTRTTVKFTGEVWRTRFVENLGSRGGGGT
jgi:hypothetical protein